MYFRLKLVVNFAMKYVFINIFIMQKQNSKLVMHYSKIFIETIHNSILFVIPRFKLQPILLDAFYAFMHLFCNLLQTTPQILLFSSS